jgi:hypothetical protein
MASPLLLPHTFLHPELRVIIMMNMATMISFYGHESGIKTGINIGTINAYFSSKTGT